MRFFGHIVRENSMDRILIQENVKASREGAELQRLERMDKARHDGCILATDEERWREILSHSSPDSATCLVEIESLGRERGRKWEREREGERERE